MLQQKKAFGVPKAFCKIIPSYSTIIVYLGSILVRGSKTKSKKSYIIFLTLSYPLLYFVFPSFYFPQN
ncbi:hypothetical protein HMPREF1977_0019 [Capnocytophaga ochracea F0287]|uniref:Uncharacterized protein n=1 Tax=Capnocytophaga ochracea F0287 TaxID=873517 RepID=E4MNQ9_CAPOC|nr:hypothetical protein HMPREF1977_0019 [Capnocytophaga ochracea F0287]